MRPPSFPSLAVERALRFAFQQLYTNFAWTYDAVAAAVSLGEWREWARAAIPFLDPARGPRRGPLLEVAHGPGHLHLALRQLGFDAHGIDLSPQMGRIARARLYGAGLTPRLVRADVRRLPFPAASFACAVSTFPADFIFAPAALREVARVLRTPGRFVVVPTAQLRPTSPLAWLAGAWTRRANFDDGDVARIQRLFEQAGFHLTPHQVPTRRADVVVWQCDKTA